MDFLGKILFWIGAVIFIAVLFISLIVFFFDQPITLPDPMVKMQDGVNFIKIIAVNIGLMVTGIGLMILSKK